MWFPLHQHTHHSFLDGLTKPEQMASRLVENRFLGGAVTDHGVLSGVPSVINRFETTCVCGQQARSHDENGVGACVVKGSTCRQFQKASLKAIAGCEFYLCEQDASHKTKENRGLSHLCVLAKGQEGWKRLLRASSESNRPANFYYKPRLSLEQLAKFAGGEWIVFSGHMGSDLANICFAEPKLAYRATSYKAARELVHEDWQARTIALAEKYRDLFGPENFYLEIQLIDHENLPASLVVAEILRYIGKTLNIPRVATADSHYARREDARDQRILLCTAFNTDLQSVQRKLDNQEDVALGGFFRSNNYHIPSAEEMAELHKDEPEELANSLVIASRCETPRIANPPMLPVYEPPDGKTPDEYLRVLCQSGWETKLSEENLPAYRARLDHELAVLSEAGLHSYFLITWDFINHARQKLRGLLGKGRGSAAGCLVSFLLNITRVDPVKYALSFERFYSGARKGSLPDIDTDFPTSIREAVIQYLRDTYGENRVCQMATFTRMQGRGAMKDVLRSYARTGYEEMNRITAGIPDESSISDELQEMMEETGEASIIRWALENNSEDLKEWAWIGDDGDIEGPLAREFAQAIRLEGTIRGQSKHASGVLISSVELADVFPMLYDKSTDKMIVGCDMRDVEVMGGVKFDILASRTLDCLMGVQRMVQTGVL